MRCDLLIINCIFLGINDLKYIRNTLCFTILNTLHLFSKILYTKLILIHMHTSLKAVVKFSHLNDRYSNFGYIVFV